MIADLHRPRLGMRWLKAAKKFDADKWAQKALRQEVGQLAAAEARSFQLPEGSWKASSLYNDPDPPGRDVWVAYNPISSRCIELVHHAHRRENILAGNVLPSLRDLAPADPMAWSVFDLSCVAPAGMKLTSHRLNAGDLSLTFERGRSLVGVRQIALAEIALKRKSLEGWLADEESRRAKHYRASGGVKEIELGNLSGKVRTLRRRRRFMLVRWLVPELLTAVFHDPDRDRLVLVQASDESLLREVASQVGSVGD
jgi:hypothetical protein